MIAALAGGCGSSHSAARSTPTALSPPAVKIAPNTHGSNPDSFYVPRTIHVKLGQTITWKNGDTDPHDATADAGAFASGPIAFGGEFRWRPLRTGRYTYFCTLHPEMHGVVVVSA
jgi:plastocyanin